MIDEVYGDAFWKWPTKGLKWIHNGLLVCSTIDVRLLCEHITANFWISSYFCSHNTTEYNPKLSEATPTTRVAYVKFMAHAMRRESDADHRNQDLDASKGETSTKNVHKSILRTASKANAVWKMDSMC